MFNRSKKNLSKMDWLLFFTTLALCLYGFFVLHSAMASRGFGWRAMRAQFLATALGFVGILLLQFFDTDHLKKLAYPIYFACVLLLLLTLLMGYGEENWGARSWLKLGPLSFQPAEFTKVGMILALAQILERYKNAINKPSTLLILAVSMGIPLLLILKQPDFGTSAVIVFFIALMIFYAGIHWGYVIGALVLALLLAPLIYQGLSEIQKNRILNFLNPLRDISGSGYQAYQGLIAIGSGQINGKGYLQGTQTQYGFVPERETDYIFTVLAEELGLLGGLLLLLLYALFIWRILHIAKSAKDTFSKCLCVGVAAMIFIHIFENIGMTMALMPVTGIPLPFLSNGGTFQLLNLLCVGLVLSVSTQRSPLDFNEAG